jgi:hypothetical protein
MTVRIGEMTSDVIVEPEAAPAGANAPRGSESWKRVEALRNAQAEFYRVRMRTRAEAFDD